MCGCNFIFFSSLRSLDRITDCRMSRVVEAVGSYFLLWRNFYRRVCDRLWSEYVTPFGDQRAFVGLGVVNNLVLEKSLLFQQIGRVGQVPKPSISSLVAISDGLHGLKNRITSRTERRWWCG